VKRLNTLESGNEEIVNECIKALNQPGTVLLLPTETVYGLICDYFDQEARERVYEFKKRPESKQLAMFLADAANLEEYGITAGADARKLIEAFCPGPVTLILPGENNSTIGLRIPNHPLVLELLKKYGKPLAATSANRSGEPETLSVDNALKNLNGKPELAVDAGEIAENSLPSTVIDLTGKDFRVLRPGPVSEKDIRRILRH
jgi:L-threonylcarbamoyladenylate synthase